MRALDRKLARDLWRLRGQVLSISAVLACGVASVLAMRSTLDSIQRARTAYYEQARFPHVFAALERAPQNIARRIAEIPGVVAADTRVTANVLLLVPGLPETAIGHVVSIPDEGEPLLNALHVRRGRAIAPGAHDEVLVNEHFARANALTIGDTLGAILNGRRQTLRIVGIALSPEFVHDAAMGGTMFSDSRHLAILWMRRDAIGPLYRMEGAFNDVALRLGPGANEREVIARLDALLAPYGGTGAYGRKDHPSDVVLSGEIEQLRVFGTAMPVIFLFVAAFLLNVVLSRLIATQREEVAALKAFGYDASSIGLHYLGYPLAAIALGSVLGIALGVWAGRAYTGLYVEFFRFPVFEHYTRLSLVVAAVAVSGAAAILGALQSLRAAMSVPPAQGMQPPAPARYKPLWLERLGWGHLLPPAARMIIRDLERRPWRTISSIIGVALAAAILVVGTFAFDSAHYMADLQFRMVEREQLTTLFASARPLRVGSELASVPGVMRVEPFRSVPIRLRAGHRSRVVSILGLPADATLRRLVDRDGSAHPVPPAGLVLTTALADLLHIEVGDTVQVELLERGSEVRRPVVVALLDELIGSGGYMELGALHRLVGDGGSLSGANLLVEPGAEDRVAQRLGELPGTSGTIKKNAMLESFDRQITAAIRLTVMIVVSLAIVVALGVIYNGHRIALSERSRDLASLRVLGFTRREVATLLFGEQGVVDAVGTPLGLLLGYALAFWIMTGFKSEQYRFPVVVSATTYLFAVLVIVVAFVLASIPMRRQVYGLDLVAVLKTRE